MSKWSMTINKDNVGLYTCVVTDDVLQYSNDYELTAHDGTPTIFDIDVPNGEKEGNEKIFVVYNSKEIEDNEPALRIPFSHNDQSF